MRARRRSFATLRATTTALSLHANHPEANPDIAELAVAGFDTHLLYDWPMTRLVVRASRLVAVHSPALADQMRASIPDAQVTAIHLGHGIPLTVRR